MKRLSHGLTNQSSLTWSRAIGEDNDGDGTLNYLDGRNRSLNKTLMSFHCTYDIRSNGIYEMLFGSGRAFLSNAPGWLSRVVERWQLGGIFSITSGAPLTLTSGVSSWNQFTGNTPIAVGTFPKSLGSITKLPGGVVTYFPNVQQITDPTKNAVTNLQGLQGSFSNFTITDANGKVLLTNPAPGQLGTLGQHWIQGPRSIGFDMNLLKRVKIAESKDFELRVDAINVLNHPQFANPNVNIDSTTFGRITATSAGNAGNRTFVVNARFSF